MTRAGDASRALAWRHGAVSVQALGGMLGPTSFLLPDGRQVCPFWTAPWHDEPGIDDPMSAALRGEWPCVPFGYPFPSGDYPARWPGAVEDRAEEPHVHGYGSNAHWHFGEARDDRIELSVDYPEDHAVKSLRRVIRPDPDAPALDLELTIEARRPCCEPVALHGCFALPRAAGTARIEPARFEVGRTHPATVEPEAPIFAQDETFQALDAVPGRGGGTVDARALPFEKNGEDLLQLDGMTGPVALVNRQAGTRPTFDWDRSVLPSLLLWYSNRGRRGPPWNGRTLLLGMEPCCTAFGLSGDMARAANPINEAGTPTCVTLDPENPLTIRYRIAIEPLEGGA